MKPIVPVAEIFGRSECFALSAKREGEWVHLPVPSSLLRIAQAFDPLERNPRPGKIAEAGKSSVMASGPNRVAPTCLDIAERMSLKVDRLRLLEMA